jgi:hypothetical protein
METSLGAVVAGLVPATPIVMVLSLKFGIAGTSPAMTAWVMIHSKQMGTAVELI